MADQYKKHTHREHILELPDTYVGSTETHEEIRWVYDVSTSKMVHRKVAFNPGFYKIFDEIIVNARDALGIYLNLSLALRKICLINL